MSRDVNEQDFAARHLANMMAALEIEHGPARARELFTAAACAMLGELVRTSSTPNAVLARTLCLFDAACNGPVAPGARALRLVPIGALLAGDLARLRATREVIADPPSDVAFPDGAA